MEKRKHILSMLLFVASCLFSNSAFAQTVESVEVDGIYYNLFLRDKTAEVTINPNKYSGEINIPGKIIYNNVTFSVASIGDNAFDDCTWLTSIAIPNSITTIGKYAFRECYCLEAVIIPNSVTSIGKGAFEDCAGLISLIIPNSVTSIGDDAFRDCTGLTSVTIPNSVTSIGGGAFDSCTGLKKVIVTDIAAWCGIEFEGRYSNPVCYAKHLYRNETTEITNLIIPNSVTSIGGYAFSGCSGLTSVTIPNSVTSIGSSAFYGCSGLTSVNIPNSVKSIGYSAFSYCSGLTSVTIPNSVTSIGEGAFSSCSGLTSVTIPNSVTSIGDGAFEGCDGLTSVTIPNSVKSIGWSALAGCSGLTTINVEAGNTVYDSRNNCNAIIETATNTLIIGCKNSTIPNSVTTIGAYAFSCCSGLTSVTIGNSVKSIEFGAFGNCTELTDVYCYAEIVPSTASDAFYNSHIENATLHVPAASIEQYKNTIPWNKFGTFLPLDESVPDRIQIDGIYYTLFVDSKTAEVTQNPDDKYIGKINIPETVPYNGVTYSVTSIGESAFENCSGLTSVTIPNSVTSIGEEAFSYCSGLTTINVEAGNTVYDSRNYCNAIIETATNTLITGCKNTTIPNSVTSIGDGAFEGCDGLTSVTIPNSVTSIGEYAFCECGGLTSVNIGNSVKNIGSEAFADCAELTDVYCYAEKVPSTNSDAFAYSHIENATLHVPAASIEQYKTTTPWSNFGTFLLLDESVLDRIQIDGIYYNLFVDSKTAEVTMTRNPDYNDIGKINIPETVSYNGVTYSVTSIGDYAFCYCFGLTSVTIPNSVISIGESAFENSGLTSITIPNSVTSIEERAFAYCDGLTSVTIPNSVTSIRSRAFEGCSRLISITIPNSVTSIEERAFAYCDGLTSVTIPNSVTSIRSRAFEGCSRLISITIPNSVTSIEEHAFAYCSGLTSVNIPNSVTSIEEGAFVCCEGLTSVTIPNSVTSIGKYVFSYCSGLTSVTIPNSVTSIGEGAFSSCSGLTSVTIPNSVTSIGDGAFEGCDGLTSVTIPNSVTSIGEYAFCECDGLTTINVEAGNTVYDSRNNCNAIIETATNTLIIGCKNSTIPNSVTTIGAYAFGGCFGLTSVTIPNSVTSIEEGAFCECVDLTSITIPNSVTSIGEEAFFECDGLTSITIPNSVTSIGEEAFSYCSGLTTINVEAGNTVYDSRNNCNAIIETATNTLITSCKNTTIPNSVTSIGDEAFDGCDGLTSVTIPNSVTSIGDYAFYNCSGLTSVTIGNGVKEIGSSAFADCAELTDVYCYAEIVPSTESDAFYWSSTENATLHVPAASIEQYMETEPWSNFGAIVPLTDEDAIAEVQAVPVLIQTQGNTIIVEGAEAGTEIILYSTNGVQLDSVIATTGVASLSTSRLSGSVAIVKIGNKTVKVLMKQ